MPIFADLTHRHQTPLPLLLLMVKQERAGGWWLAVKRLLGIQPFLL